MDQFSGVWEGKSINVKQNSVTAWRKTMLLFHQDQENKDKPQQILVEGGGLSAWRNHEIEFRLSGTFDLKTREIRVMKRHIGVFQNCVLYQGKLNMEKLQIEGEYAGGTLILTKKKSFYVSPTTWYNLERKMRHQFWAGQSVGKNEEATEWKDVTIEFGMAHNFPKGTIKGNGISIWRDQTIEFSLLGDLNWETKQILLVKHHHGKYTNRIHYQGTIDPYHCRIVGENPDSTFILQLDSTSSSILAEKSSINSRHNRKLGLGASSKSTLPTLPMSIIHSAERQACAKLVNLYGQLLSGIWHGESTDVENSQTVWTDTSIQFRLNPHRQDGIIQGRGISIWRGERINFILSGKMNWHTGSLILIKQHTGKFTNSLEYEAVFRYSLKDMDADKSRNNSNNSNNNSEEKENSDTPSDDDDPPELHTLNFGDSYDNNRLLGDMSRLLANAQIFIFGRYSSGKIRLVRDRDFSRNTLDLLLKEQKERRQKTCTSAAEDISESKKDTTSTDERRVIDRSSLTKTNSSFYRAERYLVFLGGLLANGKIKGDDLHSLAKYREQMGVTTAEHDQALNTLGWSEALLQIAVQEYASKSVQDDLCKLCFNQAINAVILPCGHFSVCMDCGNELRSCPICRRHIHKIQQIFRA